MKGFTVCDQILYFNHYLQVFFQRDPVRPMWCSERDVKMEIDSAGEEEGYGAAGTNIHETLTDAKDHVRKYH